MEEWRDIEGYEGKYQISNLGNVKSLNYCNTKKAKNLKHIKDKDGYLLVCLSKNGSKKLFKVHRLVAKAFLDNLNNYPQVNHKDENKENNRVSNLQWVTPYENINYGTRLERVKKSLKNNSKRSKCVIGISVNTNEIIRYPSLREAQRNGFSSFCIAACCKKKRSVHKGYLWEYVS
ncbi:NUMOD4 domain-containing protein [Clostridium perfringens]|uniref:NUMOD4 domain-containing protein n=1 Tax=Clostridium perfringens TaxID=1502 RepID=UPI000F5464C9|nr:NUMOD4 domain-containing protein [Clostridium perfringens]